jgi:shikimate dehydrogenase
LENKSKYGLIGKNIDYSFSRKYFTDKFDTFDFKGFSYENFDIQNIEEFTTILKNNPELKGLNVTIPYKESVLPFLDSLSNEAMEIGAVNVIKINEQGVLKGYNSDWFGFKKSIEPLLQKHHKKALLLGTGGASKAIAYALKKLEIEYSFVSRTPSENAIEYSKLTKTLFDNYQIIINCTPLGTHPKIELFPEIPYEFFTTKHIAFDLIYNPEKTTFLEKAALNGATIKNGLEMLIFQAEKSWEIWNEE